MLIWCDLKEKRQLRDSGIQQTNVCGTVEPQMDVASSSPLPGGATGAQKGGKSFYHRGPNMARGDNNQKTGMRKKRNISVMLLWFHSH